MQALFELSFHLTGMEMVLPTKVIEWEVLGFGSNK